MHQVTIFGDIYANHPAIDAVLADMDSRGPTNRYCLAIWWAMAPSRTK